MGNPEDASIINKYNCFVTNYFCFYNVWVTDAQMQRKIDKKTFC